MLLLVSGATTTVRKYSYHPNLGCLLTPDTGNKIETMSYLPWAADNAAFSGFNEIKFLRMLDKIQGTIPIYVTCPDVVCDAQATLDLFQIWEPIIHSKGFPVAFVIQNGIEHLEIPWDRIDTIFIGGDTEFKLGKIAREIVYEAKRHGKWVHMGRVNTPKRIQYAMEIGCDSIDGTGFSMYPQTHIPWALSILSNEQLTLFKI